MSIPVHRNIAKGQTCPGCMHFHGVEKSNVPGASGICLKNPPHTFMVGMLPSAASAIKGGPPDLVPVLRAFFPPVGPTESCSEWTPQPKGEA